MVAMSIKSKIAPSLQPERGRLSQGGILSSSAVFPGASPQLHYENVGRQDGGTVSFYPSLNSSSGYSFGRDFPYRATEYSLESEKMPSRDQGVVAERDLADDAQWKQIQQVLESLCLNSSSNLNLAEHIYPMDQSALEDSE